MRFYLARFIGSGKDADSSLRPSGHDLPEYAGMIDLRGDSTKPDGYALIAAKDALPASPSRVLLTDDPDDATAATRQRVASRLGLNLDALPFRRLVLHLLRDHADDANPARWNRLRPTVEGRLQVHLGGLLIDEWAPRSLSAGIVESFDKADADTLGPLLSWTEVAGDIDVVSNEARTTTIGSEVWARADSDLATVDHYCEARVGASDETGSSDVGLIIRKDSAVTKTFYHSRIKFSSNTCQILKCVAGTYTQFELPAFTANFGTIYRLRIVINGSTFQTFINGAQVGTDQTDTAITTGTRCGLLAQKNTGGYVSWDDWMAADMTDRRVQVPSVSRSDVVRSSVW